MRCGGGGVDHHLRVAVVRRHDRPATGRLDCVHYLSQAPVDRLHGRDRRRERTRVAHHVRIGEIHQHETVLPAAKGIGHPGRDLVRAHLRFLVVGGHVPRRGDQDPVLAVEGPLVAAIEEISDVWVFFRFRHAQLTPAGQADRFSQDFAHAFRGTKGAGHIETRIVGRHGGHVYVRRDTSVESVKIPIDEGPDDLAPPVGPEIEDDHRVAVRDRAGGAVRRWACGSFRCCAGGTGRSCTGGAGCRRAGGPV